MPDLLEKESVEETTEVIAEKEYTDEDLLNRQPFIDKVKTIIELQAAQKQSCCFAINGSWGVGKTFVLNKLEKQLEEIVDDETSNDKYMIFHYNCWQYDYYEEPLIAIVSSMLDTIDEKEHLISDENRSKVKGLLKAVGSALLIKANKVIEDKTGFNPKELIDIVTDAGEYCAEQIEEQHKYDSNFIFKATLKKLQDTLRVLSKEKTIIFVVDELDRCLPEYAVKVLERLHHVFEEVSNVQVILSIDKGQLKHIVKTTFGDNTKTEKYLSKFISFYLNLDEGSIDESLFNYRFKYYTKYFDFLNKNTSEIQVNEFKTRIFDGLDMRCKIEILDRCCLLHKMLKTEDNKSDFSIMCIEIFLSIIFYYKVLDREQILPRFDIHNVFNLNNSFNPKGLNYLNDIYKSNDFEGIKFLSSMDQFMHVSLFNIYSVIFYSYRLILNFNDYISRINMYDADEIVEHTKKFWELLNVIF